MVIQVRNSDDPKDVWVEFTRKEGFWIDEDGERPNSDIEFGLENLMLAIQREDLWVREHA